MPWTKTEIQQFYDSYAKSYDAETSQESYPAPFILSCWLMSEMSEMKTGTVTMKNQINILDVGCGTGQSSSLFFAQSLVDDHDSGHSGHSYAVTGVDASPKVIT